MEIYVLGTVVGFGTGTESDRFRPQTTDPTSSQIVIQLIAMNKTVRNPYLKLQRKFSSWI